VIWNPSIRKHKKVPFEPVDDKLDKQVVRFNLAFGYDPVNNDYKVLRIVIFDLESKTKSLEEVKVYSLKAHSWRRVKDQLPSKEPFIISSPQSVFTNGAFHWLVKSITRAMTLLTFNLTTEKFGVQKLPFKPNLFAKLEVLEGLLCISAYTRTGDIKVLKMNEYGVTSSWSRLCKVPVTSHYCRSLAFSKDGKKVLMEDDKVFWYDIKKKTRTIVKHISNKYYWTATCARSLFLLDGDNDN
jgi:F-box interacting protein